MFVFLGEESRAIEDTDANVNSVLVGDWMTQEACEGDAAEEA